MPVLKEWGEASQTPYRVHGGSDLFLYTLLFTTKVGAFVHSMGNVMYPQKRACY